MSAAESDSGAQLRSLYRAEGGTGQVFSAKVADYLGSRPDYPTALFDALQAQAGLAPGAEIADIGAGTGLLTAGLLARGWRVLAVEPNAEMRAAADALLGGRAGYRSAAGSAEALPLADASVDLLTAAQAFHWFEIEAARREALRVLRPQGQVALIWNDRVSDDALHRALDPLFDEYGGAKRAALIAHEDRAGVPRFFGAGIAVQQFDWPHEHRLDASGLQSLVFSRSYMPARDSAAGRQVQQALGRLFERFAEADGRLAVRYRTVASIGRPG